jgi:hypothetical protein
MDTLLIIGENVELLMKEGISKEIKTRFTSSCTAAIATRILVNLLKYGWLLKIDIPDSRS